MVGIKHMRRMALALLLVNLSVVGSVRAETTTVVEEIKAVKERLVKLESGQSSAKSTDEGSPITTLFEGVKISGTIDSIYSYNFNSPSQGTSIGRVFDRDHNSINLNAAKLSFQKAAEADSPLGFRTDILAGQDAKLIHAAGMGESNDAFDLEQAFAEVHVGSSKLLDGMNDFNLKVGKFVTLAGAEVIESKDNWNTSRSLAFGYAVPFTHTGVRGTYTFDNGWDIALGVNNGWDVANDNNDGKTIETHIGFNNIELPADSSLTIALQGYFGPEAVNNDSAKRNLGDAVVTYKTPWKPLTLVYNFDYATEDDAVDGSKSGSWYAHAGYARYDIDEEWSVTGRGEYFSDEDGLRIAAGTPANYREFTATLEYRPVKGLITRLEYRNDHADTAVFDDKDGLSKNQNTISGEVIVTF